MNDVVVVGMGQLGSVFAHAFLRAGRRVTSVNRNDDPRAIDVAVEMAVVAVGESELQSVVSTLPDWPLVLVQNGLLPADWAPWDRDPTVGVIWFEKKKTIALNVIRSSPIAGPHAEALVDVLACLDVPAHVVSDEALARELVLKNVYIVAFNVLGLEHGGTVGELFTQRREAFDAITSNVLDVQEALLGQQVDRAAVLDGLIEAIEGDPSHGARGRSAPARLERVLAEADAHGIDVKALRSLAARVS